MIAHLVVCDNDAVVSNRGRANFHAPLSLHSVSGLGLLHFPNLVLLEFPSSQLVSRSAFFHCQLGVGIVLNCVKTCLHLGLCCPITPVRHVSQAMYDYGVERAGRSFPRNVLSRTATHDGRKVTTDMGRTMKDYLKIIPVRVRSRRK